MINFSKITGRDIIYSSLLSLILLLFSACFSLAQSQGENQGFEIRTSEGHLRIIKVRPSQEKDFVHSLVQSEHSGNVVLGSKEANDPDFLELKKQNPAKVAFSKVKSFGQKHGLAIFYTAMSTTTLTTSWYFFVSSSVDSFVSAGVIALTLNTYFNFYGNRWLEYLKRGEEWAKSKWKTPKELSAQAKYAFNEAKSLIGKMAYATPLNIANSGVFAALALAGHDQLLTSLNSSKGIVDLVFTTLTGAATGLITASSIDAMFVKWKSIFSDVSMQAWVGSRVALFAVLSPFIFMGYHSVSVGVISLGLATWPILLSGKSESIAIGIKRGFRKVKRKFFKFPLLKTTRMKMSCRASIANLVAN